MHEPLIDRQLLVSLRLAHGAYNLTILLLFLYQGWLGLKIRRARTAHAALPFPVIKRHRRNGPFLAGLALAGFLFGTVLVLLDTGNILEYPPHFVNGCLLMICIGAAVALSRRIKGQQSGYRTPHFIFGQALLVLYAVEAFLGIGVFL